MNIDSMSTQSTLDQLPPQNSLDVEKEFFDIEAYKVYKYTEK